MGRRKQEKEEAKEASAVLTELLRAQAVAPEQQFGKAMWGESNTVAASPVWYTTGTSGTSTSYTANALVK